jgi:hypothetical protein
MATVRGYIHSSWQQDQRQSMEHTWSARKGEVASPINQNAERCEVYHYDSRIQRIDTQEIQECNS